MEPERPLEKILRAFAKKRRDQSGAPMELSSGARQRLHQEIARRTAGKREPGFFESLFNAFRPRLVFVACAVAVLGVGAVLLLPALQHGKTRSLTTLSMADSKLSAAPPAESPAPALAQAPLAENPPVTAPAASAPPVPAGENHKFKSENRADTAARVAQKPVEPTVSLRDRHPSVAVDKPIAQTNTLAGKVPTAAAPETPAAPAVVPLQVSSGSFAAGRTSPAPRPSVAASSKDIATPELAFAAPEPNTEKKLALEKTAPPAAANAANFYQVTNPQNNALNVAAAQYMNQIQPVAHRQRAAEATKAPQPVLASFRVEQNGDTLRMIDADGSVYTGAVRVGWNETAPGAASNAALADAVKNEQQNQQLLNSIASNVQRQEAQSYSFRVAGTNRALNQNVVFTGNFVPITNVNVFANSGNFGGAAGAQRAIQQNFDSSVLLNSRISGKAVVGNKSEVNVDATPQP